MKDFFLLAIVGQKDVKEAIILNLINPKIGGLLIDGPRGTGKSFLASSIKNLTNLSFTKLPLNISEDRLLGSIDLEKTMQSGRLELQRGLLEEAKDGYLFIDDIALLSDGISDILISILSSGEIKLEREGFSRTSEVAFSLIATMNSGEAMPRKSLIDHFGLYVKSENLNSPKDRLDIDKVVLSFTEDKQGFVSKYESEEKNLKKEIEAAKKILEGDVVFEEDIYLYLLEKIEEANVEGHRADLVMKETALAVAAMNKRSFVIKEDIDEAAYFVLPHRKRMNEQDQEQEQEQDKEDPKEENKQEENKAEDEKQSPMKEKESEESSKEGDQEQNKEDEGEQRPQQGAFKGIPKAFDVADPFEIEDFAHKKDRRYRKSNGRRTQTRSKRLSGRYIYSTISNKNKDLAIDATIRAAAPYQIKRDKAGKAISIKKEDFRNKVRQSKMANLLVFVVDASASMGAIERMSEAKGVVLSILKDAYIKRDKVSLITFSGEEAQLVLPPTSSVERGYKLLKDVETGGKSPLNSGIEKGINVIRSQLRQNADLMPLLILITDGRGNVSIDSNKKPLAELMEIAQIIRKQNLIESMVIDIEANGLMTFGIAKKVSDILEGKYYRLEDLKKGDLEMIVREEMY